MQKNNWYRFFWAVILLLNLALKAPLQAQTQPKPKSATQPSPTSADDPQLYRNATFGLSFKTPYGWVDRTKEMRQGAEPGKTDLLLAVFERPPDATGDTINSAVVFASESAASYPGLKKAEDYLGPLTDLATAKGFKAEGEPYSIEVESRQLLRADFTKPINDKLMMHQCTLVLIAKGQIVSFTFIAGGDAELDELMDGLHFNAPKSPPHRNPK